MRQVMKTVYSFSELSDTAQEKALSTLWDINVDYDWWESVYEDAKNVGLKITAFDIDRPSYCEASFIEDADYTACSIVAEHGESCETHLDAKRFLSDWCQLVEKYSDGKNKNEVAENNEYEFDKEAEELEREFLKTLSEDYLSMLRREYKYLTSEEAIKESIGLNGYEFDEDGNLQ